MQSYYKERKAVLLKFKFHYSWEQGTSEEFKSLSLRSPTGAFSAALSWSHWNHTPSWSTLILSDSYTWVTARREQGTWKARGKGLGHTMQWVENISSMSIQTCLFGGALGSFSSDTAGVNQALRERGQIIHWTRGVFWSYCLKLSALHESHHRPGLYSSWCFHGYLHSHLCYNYCFLMKA